MLQKNDLIILLSEMESKGGDVGTLLTKVVSSNEIPMDVLKFINDNRHLDVSSFYERIRKNYNNKKSDLYKNIVKDIDDPQEVLTTISAFVLQVILYSKHVEDKAMFFKHVRLEEATRVLNTYSKTYDITSSLSLLRVLKADIKAFESIK